MFEWFRGTPSTDGLSKIRLEFSQMLDAGKNIFSTSANCLLGGTDPKVIKDEVFESDKRINKSERQIRRELVVHATVHGAPAFPTALVMMSIVKDAERVGDYAKNIFELAEISGPAEKGDYKETLQELKGKILNLIDETRSCFEQEDVEKARLLMEAARGIERECDEQILRLIQSNENDGRDVTRALAFRYFKRVASHTFNILTSVVQPIDKLDYPERNPAAH